MSAGTGQAYLADIRQVTLPPRDLVDEFSLFVRCAFIRKFERLLLELFAQGKLAGTTHTAIGQEANAVGLAAACRDTDIFISNHRCHGHLLAHVGEPEGLLLELMGHPGGFCRGLGGSQHLCVPGKFYSNGVQGGIAPLAAGLAMAAARAGENKVVCVFLGDGTTGEGVLYETLNLAALHHLPILFVLEDNGIAQTTLTKNTIAGRVKTRFEGFGIEAHEIEYPTARELFELAAPIVARVRGGMPSAIIIKSTRLAAHSKGDDTRSSRELAEAEGRDPLRRMAHGLQMAEQLRLAERTVDEIFAGLVVAHDPPPLGQVAPAASYADFTIEDRDFVELNGTALGERLNMRIAEFLEHERSMLLGEDIGDPYGGAFKISKGLQCRAPAQVLEMPISEQGFTGMAAGLAIAGWRPMVEIMFGDFVALAFDQILNHAAKYSLMYDGQVDCPLVIRLPMGGGRGYGPTHSQNLEKHLCGIPDLQVLAVSAALPTAPFFRTLKQARKPVVVIEYKLDYARKIDRDAGLLADFEIVSDGETVEFTAKGCGEAEIVIFAYGGMVLMALEAALELLIDHELVVGVVAVGRLHPLNIDGFLKRRGGNLRFAAALEESSVAWGFGAEIAAQLLASRNVREQPGFVRIGALDTIVPASRASERQVLPDAAKVVAAIAAKVVQG
jgi:2-oxoisovalerate dehydrogenase E1 component